MSPRTTRRTHAILSALAASLYWAQIFLPDVSAKIVEPFEQGFLFNWQGDPPNATAEQCSSLPITWSRNGATGPSPAAPYYLQVYTSTFVVPFVIPAGSGLSFDWPVPFVPGTLFQICMMASNGVTGGCQEIYTVIPQPNTTLANPPTCQNLTYPQPDQVLDIKPSAGSSGWSQYGWIPQCSDITLTPVNGTPPYTYTISPALRPPFNFTSDNMDSVDWTVTLPFGLPFWITVADSKNNTWTNGPLHASGGATSCFASSSSNTVSTGGAIGIAFGSLIVGLAVGAVGGLFLLRRFRRTYTAVQLRSKSSDAMGTSSLPFSPFSPPPSSTASGFRSQHSRNTTIDPFIITQEESTSASQQQPAASASGERPPTSPSHAATGSTSSSTLPLAAASGQGSATSPTSPGPSFGQHVYVVHHDAGRPPPVTVFTSDGTEVVELPPQYETATDSRGAGQGPRGPRSPTSLEGPRRPRALPLKAPRLFSSGSES